MKHTISGAVLGAVLGAGFATSAFAGGLDRSGQDITLLFESGNTFKFSAAYVDPNITSTAGGVLTDAGPGYVQLGFGYKHDLSDSLSLAVIYDQPYGANIRYTDGAFNGVGAEVSSHAVTGLLRYKMGNGFGVHGGLRLQQLTGVVSTPLVAGDPDLDVNSDWAAGGVVGVSWEKPEIAARVALTYSSEVSHTMTGIEFGGTVNFAMVTPQSVNLDFQTGITPTMLVFGSIRWVNWDGFTIDGPGAGTWLSYDDDVITYSLGVGRKFSDNWSAAVTVGYERSTGDPSTPLGPTDGYISLGLGATYTMDNGTKISGGVRHVWLGDTTVSGAPFTDNTAIAVGLSITHTF